MKQLLLPLLLCSLCAAPALAQHGIRAGEYFIDTDPGVGNGAPLLLPTVADSLDIYDAVAIPANLAPGQHFLYVRTFADSLGSYGRWSQTQRLAIYVKDVVAYAEYFIDADPGVGNGTALAIPTADSVNEDYAIPTTGLATGTHYLYVRTRSTGGRWSLTNRKQFNITRDLATAEYFIDTDPGVGNGTALTIPTADSINEDLSVTLPGGLASGVHYLYVRSRDNSGAWSLAQRTRFFVNTSLAAAEYFIDTDPGVGNGAPLVIPTADSVNEDLSVVLPNDIAAGRHDLYVRARDVDGRWGLTQRKQFFVNSAIVAAEYFFDTDPGAGNGTAWPALASPTDSVNDTAGIRVPCLPAGTHYVYVRTRDARGVWSLAHMDTFTLNAPTLTLTGAYPGPGPYGTPVRVKAAGGEGPYLYSMSGGGGYTPDSVFLAANGSAVAFMATDTCGYSGSLTVNTPAAPQNIATAASASLSVPSDGSWRHWYYLLDGAGDIVAAIRDNGQNLGTVTAGYYRNSGAVRQFPSAWDSNLYLDRNWLINVANQPDANVGVRLYALTGEFDALNAADPEINAMSDLRVFKYDGPNEDLTFGNNNASLGGVVIAPDSLAMYAGASTSGYWMDFSVGSFSEFYQSAQPANPLYVQSLDLQATPADGRVQVSWQAVNEQDVRHYTVLRSADGVSWTPLGEVPARNLAYATYGFEDAQPLTGNSFYRLAVHDLRGAVTYSGTVQVSLRAQSAISIYPNPARDRVTIAGVAAGSGITLLDAAGREVWSGAGNGQSTMIRVDDLPSGVYLLRVVDRQSGAVQTERLQVSGL